QGPHHRRAHLAAVDLLHVQVDRAVPARGVRRTEVPHNRGRCGISMETDWPGRNWYARRGRTVSSVRSMVRRSTETTSASHQSGLDSEDVSAASTMIRAIIW